MINELRPCKTYFNKDQGWFVGLPQGYGNFIFNKYDHPNNRSGVGWS